MNNSNTPESPAKNRILELVLMYADMEAQHRVDNPAVRKNNPAPLQLQASRYENIISGYRQIKGLSKGEKATLRFVKYDLQRTKARLNPSMASRLLYSRHVRFIESFMAGQLANRTTHQEVIAGLEKKIQVDTMASVLSAQMKQAGFKDYLEKPLRDMLQHSNLPAFNLRYYDVQKKDADYLLHFKKIPGTDVFYFEKFDVTIRPDLPALLHRTPTHQTLSTELHSAIPLNAEESRRLARDRAIQKTVDGQQVWLAHGVGSLNTVSFDLTQALYAWPIQELNGANGKEVELLKGLAAGKQVEITLSTPQGDRKLQVSVGPAADGQHLQLYFRNDRGHIVDAHREVHGQTAERTVYQMMNALSPSRKGPRAARGLS